jgi:hypothetical protein
MDEIRIIPDHLAGQRWKTHDEPNHRKNKIARPFFAAESDEFSANSGDQSDTAHTRYEEGKAALVIKQTSVLPVKREDARTI